jgi:PPOX class probable F420-dependent enzyme
VGRAADVRRVIEGTSIAHLATILPDGSPHTVPLWVHARGEQIVFLTGPDSVKARNLRRDPRVALSIAPVDDPFTPVLVRGRVVDWLEGDAAWEIVDEVARKYIGGPYSREQERVVGVIEPSGRPSAFAERTRARIAQPSCYTISTMIPSGPRTSHNR